MPGVTRPHDRYFYDLVDQLKKRLTALEWQTNFGIRDASGLIRAQGGLLPSGDYGFAVSDVNGQTTEILPVYQDDSHQGPFTTSSTSYVDLGGPSVTPIIGASRLALVTMSTYVGIPGGTGGTQSGGFVGITLDSGSLGAYIDEGIYFANTAAGASAVGMAARQSYVTIAQFGSSGPHTLKFAFKMVGPGSVTFEGCFLSVKPI